MRRRTVLAARRVRSAERACVPRVALGLTAMLCRYVHLVPAMVADCLAQQSVRVDRARRGEVIKPVGWAFREHLSDEQVDQLRQAHELRQAMIDKAQRERRSPGEVRRAPEPSRTLPRTPPYVLLDLLESSFEHQKGLAALQRVLEALARIPGLEIHASRHLVWGLARAIGESAARASTTTAEREPGPAPGSPHGGPAPSGAPAELGLPRAPAALPDPDDGFDVE